MISKYSKLEMFELMDSISRDSTRLDAMLCFCLAIPSSISIVACFAANSFNNEDVNTNVFSIQHEHSNEMDFLYILSCFLFYIATKRYSRCLLLTIILIEIQLKFDKVLEIAKLYTEQRTERFRRS